MHINKYTAAGCYQRSRVVTWVVESPALFLRLSTDDLKSGDPFQRVPVDVEVVGVRSLRHEIRSLNTTLPSDCISVGGRVSPSVTPTMVVLSADRLDNGVGGVSWCTAMWGGGVVCDRDV